MKPAESDAFLREKLGQIKLLQRAAVTNVVSLGKCLTEVRKTVGRGKFQAWLPTTGLSRPGAYRLIRVAKVFGPLLELSQRETKAMLCPSAAYALSQNSAPPGAAAYAVQLLQDGVRVDAAEARAILDAHKPVKLEKGDLAKLAPLGQRDRQTKVPQIQQPVPVQAAVEESPWAIIDALLAGGASLHLSHSPDASPELKGLPAESYTGALYVPDGKARHVCRKSPRSVLLALADQTPRRVCRECEKELTEDDFYQDINRPGGLSACCIVCDKSRVKAAKAAMKARRADGSRPRASSSKA